MDPKVSVIWLNYNSSHVIDITQRSLRSILKIDYPNFEVILVDNGSDDGSDKIIEAFVAEFAQGSQIRFVKLNQNLGFTGGMNAGFALRDRSSDYVSLLHNDVLVKSDYLKKIVPYLENHEDVGVIQGIVVSLMNESVVDSSGYMMDESLTHVTVGYDCMASTIISARYVTYVEGTMPVYRVCMVKDVLKSDSLLFVPCGFLHYLEDVFLSLMLWNQGYKSIVIPSIVGSHYRLAVTNKFGSKVPYFAYRNRIALIYITNSADRFRLILKYFRQVAIGKASFNEKGVILRSLIEGLRLGKLLKKRFGTINIYNSPLCATSLKNRLLI